MDDESEETFEALLRYLRDSRGFDFTGYKRTTLKRRIRHRMAQVGSHNDQEYLDLLQANPDEFVALFNTILINVTSFFRDPDAWEFIQEHVIPQVCSDRGPDEPIRVWSAGCAAGQEAYTLAILLAEALGTDEFRRRVKIYATDIDEQALNEARAATYDAADVETLPPGLLEKYFESTGGRFTFRKDLRRAVIFGRNDLVKDAPISKVDLLVCRNTLMYLNADTQRTVLARLNFALAPTGFLFLGKAEMLLGPNTYFTPVELKHRIFRKTPGASLDRERLDAAYIAGRQEELSGLGLIREHAFRASPVAQIVVTENDTVAMVNHQAEILFGLSPRDVGRPLRDLEVSYRPVELRGPVEQAKIERRSDLLAEVHWERAGADSLWFDVHINPLVDGDRALLGVSVAFFDVTATRTLLDKLGATNAQLEAAYEQLQSTNEELETTNEELQSTVEELETTNEELQSTNEELETMNEELQSTNDELHTINDTLSQRSLELDRARTFVSSLADSIRLGMVVVDREMRVVLWNLGCEELWGVRSEETVGKAFTGLDIGLPMESVTPLLGHALVDGNVTGTTSVEAVNRRGRSIRLQLSCSAFRARGSGIDGAVLLMDERA